jgi:hypothetical protein
MKRLLALLVLIAVLVIPVASEQIFIARGEPTGVQMDVPGGTCWLFSDYGNTGYYGIAPQTSDNSTLCSITKEVSHALSPGGYTLLYEEPAYINGKKFVDVTWVNDTLVSSLSKTHVIDEHGNTANVIREDLKHLIDENGLNTYHEVGIKVEDPYLKVSDMGQSGENLYTVSGTSNFNDGTQITIKIDDVRYYSQHDESFTHKTQVNRPSNEMVGVWKKDMLMPIQTMTPGWHNLSVIAGDLRTEAQFKIDEQEWGPRPTPTQYIKYLSDGNIAPIIVTVTVVQPPITVYQDRWYTATPTPYITDALGDKINYPYSPGEVIPPWVAGVGLLVVVAIILWRDYKWK